MRMKYENPNGPAERHRHRGRHHHHQHERHGGRHGGRLFSYGELRLLLLAMIAERPRHGYELIKEIEERFSGTYSPSPGVIYPTLAWLDDMGYAAVETAEGSRKRYRLTPEGEAFLQANRDAAEELRTRKAISLDQEALVPVFQAMDRLKEALGKRLRQGPVDQATAERIASTLTAAAESLEEGR